jgi:hypothetical protein
VSYHGKRDGTVGHEVVVQAWQVCAAAAAELDGGLYIDAQSVAVLDRVEDLLLRLLQQLLLDREVLDHGSRVADAGVGGDVVERGMLCQRARRGRRQEPRVDVAERHDAVELSYLLLDAVVLMDTGCKCCGGWSGV